MKHTENLLERLHYLYDIHLTLFIHSNDFVQQRTSQFSTFNTILFAIAGLMLSSVFDENPKEAKFSSLGLVFISFMGVFSAGIWYFSYRRSAVYRDIHRLTLNRLDTELLEISPSFNFDEKAFLHGPFELRHKVMYKNEKLDCYTQTLSTNFWSKKRKRFNVEIIPVISFVLWLAIFILSSISFLSVLL